MDKNGVSILKPEKGEIKKSVEAYEEEWGFGDKLIYDGCVKRMDEVKLNNITEKDVKESIRVFLINWGTMGRVLWRKDMERWEGRMSVSLRKISSELEKFKELHLEDIVLDNYEEKIKKCYDEISKVVKYVATGKVLHLIFPNFFPLWDTAIREGVNKEWRKSNKGKIDITSIGYYNYMRAMQEFIKREKEVLSNLSDRYKKPKLRIADEFMWWVKNKV